MRILKSITVFTPRAFQAASWCGHGWLVRTNSSEIQWALEKPSLR